MYGCGCGYPGYGYDGIGSLWIIIIILIIFFVLFWGNGNQKCCR